MASAGRLRTRPARPACSVMVRTLALELAADGVTANAVLPRDGRDREGRRAMPAEVRERVLAASSAAASPRSRRSPAWSPSSAPTRASYVTGASIPVDGGIGMNLSLGRNADRPRGSSHPPCGDNPTAGDPSSERDAPGWLDRPSSRVATTVASWLVQVIAIVARSRSGSSVSDLDPDGQRASPM